MVSGGLSAAFFFRHGRSGGETTEVDVSNPFSITEALKFAVVFVIVLVLSEQLQAWLGEQGVYLSALLAGTTDVDAITLSLARLYREGLDPSVAAGGLLLAAASNTLTKAGMVVFIGGWQVGYRVLGILLPALLAGAGVIWLQAQLMPG